MREKDRELRRRRQRRQKRLRKRRAAETAKRLTEKATASKRPAPAVRTGPQEAQVGAPAATQPQPPAEEKKPARKPAARKPAAKKPAAGEAAAEKPKKPARRPAAKKVPEEGEPG